ncbi:hypothetical protein MTO96_035028 [Rhipicephalus appendiculatus]
MHVARPSIRCLLGLLFLLYTLVQGPSYVFAGTAKPGLDPLYYFKGRLGGARPPRRYPNLPTIREEGPPPPSDSTSGNDPLYYFPGSLGVARPPRIRRSLPIIPEGGKWSGKTWWEGAANDASTSSWKRTSASHGVPSSRKLSP